MEEYQESSLSSRVYQRLRDDILSGKYREQDELREIAIGKELGVSRTPVREALRQLEMEGLVTTVPNKGAFVNGIKQKDVEDIFRIRILLEGLCARWAVERITDEQLSRMEEIILLSEFHTKHENPVNIQQVMELDGQFHAVLYEASGSKILGSTLKDFHRYVQSARRTSVSSADRARKSIREHRLIFKAVRERDENLAEQLAQEHIIHVMENLKMGG